MKCLLILPILLFIGLLFIYVVFLVLKNKNELNYDRCNNCLFYDIDMKYCWAKESRIDGNTIACDSDYKRDENRKRYESDAIHN